ncbi:MAG: NADH-quinone oxidoreductase subunit J [Chloroflexota bacterium]|nr:NADH-quinone oxidoreductase subunit J [Chloroflexota bacterium]
MTSSISFWPVLAACIVAFASALGVVIERRAMRAVVALLAHSLSIAALYALLAAGLVAVGQVLIYSGAIVVLFLFVVTLLPPGGVEVLSDVKRLTAAVCVALVLLAALATAISGAAGGQLAAVSQHAQASPIGSVAGVGHQLFDSGKLVVPFELTTFLLLVAIVGAVALWRRQGDLA